MPGFDRNGSENFGPVTGRGRGLCSRVNNGPGRQFSGETNYEIGYGCCFRGGSRPGLGMRRDFDRSSTQTFPSNSSIPADELNDLKVEEI